MEVNKKDLIMIWCDVDCCEYAAIHMHERLTKLGLRSHICYNQTTSALQNFGNMGREIGLAMIFVNSLKGSDKAIRAIAETHKFNDELPMLLFSYNCTRHGYWLRIHGLLDYGEVSDQELLTAIEQASGITQPKPCFA